jgi:hypothetical protein
MKTLLTSLASAVLVASPAFAAGPLTMTFTSTNGPATMVGNGQYAGWYYSGTSVTTWADGKKTNSNFTCVATTNPPSDRIFDVTTVCDATGAEGNFSMVWGCNALNPEKTANGCVGGFDGKSGMYAGKRGAGTFSGTMTGGTGTGQWAG